MSCLGEVGAAGEAPAPRIAVIGLGNVLMGDDAIDVPPASAYSVGVVV